MYDSISGWIKYLNDKGFKLTESRNLKEMFLVRNVLIHNNKIVGQELEKEIGGKRYQIGKNINITNNDIKKFKEAVEELANNISSEYNRKTNKKTNANKV